MALLAAGHKVRVINGGVSGDTTAGGLARLDWLMQDRPDVVIVELGGNDALRGLPPAGTRRNLDGIIKRVKEKGAKVILAGMLAPPNLGKEYGREFNALFPALAKKHQAAFYTFFLDGVASEPHLNQRDGIHPNRAGVDEIVRRILPSVKAVLNDVKQ